MSIVSRLFGCFGRRDDTHHHSHSSSFDSTKQQHIVDPGAAATGVARRKSSNGKAPLRVRFNVPVQEVFKSSSLHAPLRELLVYIIREGLRVNDLFRRPGNSADMKCIMKQLADGRPVNWPDYNFYTVANTAKKFLLNIPGGIFGIERERAILDTFECDDAARTRTIGSHLQAMPTGARQFLVLLFGAWYLTIYGCNSSSNSTSASVNSNAGTGGSLNGSGSAAPPNEAATPNRASLAIQLEAVSKSVCGSLFHTCDEPRKVDRAVEILKTMISQFANATQHGADMLEYFARVTNIDVRKSSSEPQASNADPVPAPAAVRPACTSVSRNASRTSRVSRHSSKRTDAAARMAATVDMAPVAAEYLQAVSTPDFLIVHVHVDVSSSAPSTANQPGLLQIAGRNQPRSLAVGSSEPSGVPGSSCEAHLLHIRTPVSRFNSVRRRQLDRLKKRSEWFREVPHTPTSLSTLFQERWRAAIEQLETRQREAERSAGIADLQTAHSGPEIDVASSTATYSPFQFVSSILLRAGDENDSLDTPASEPLRRAWLGSRRDELAPTSPLGTQPSTSAHTNERPHENDAHEHGAVGLSRNGHETEATHASSRRRPSPAEQHGRKNKDVHRPFIVAEDEPSSSVTVERFEFEPCASDDEHWSANTVL